MSRQHKLHRRWLCQRRIEMLQTENRILKLEFKILGEFSPEEDAKLQAKLATLKELREVQETKLNKAKNEYKNLRREIRKSKKEIREMVEKLPTRLEKVFGIEDLLLLKFIRDYASQKNVTFTEGRSLRSCTRELLTYLAAEWDLPEPRGTAVYRLQNGEFVKLDEQAAQAVGFKWEVYDQN